MTNQEGKARMERAQRRHRTETHLVLDKKKLQDRDIGLHISDGDEHLVLTVDMQCGNNESFKMLQHDLESMGIPTIDAENMVEKYARKIIQEATIHTIFS